MQIGLKIPNILKKKPEVINKIYSSEPENLQEFRQKHIYFNPNLVENSKTNISFVNFLYSDLSQKEIKDRLTELLNIRYNAYGQKKTYEELFKKFNRHSKIASQIIKDIMKRTKLPKEEENRFFELKEIANCHDLYELALIYKNSNSKRTKFEVLRKLGLIQLLARIDKTHILEKTEFAVDYIRDIAKNKFNYNCKENLYKYHDYNNLKKSKMSFQNINQIFYFWIDYEGQLRYYSEEQKAIQEYNQDLQIKKKLNIKAYPLQIFKNNSEVTYNDKKILHMQIRNKFKASCDSSITGANSYTSFVEKIIRKNLDFITDVHDIIGMRIIVEKSEDVQPMVSEIDNYFGDKTMRRKEKTNYDKFKKIGPLSSLNYQVWKAVCEILIPRPYIQNARKVLELIDQSLEEDINTIQLKEILKDEIKDCTNNPESFIIEIQIQDLSSYLLSIAHGSDSNHKILKMKQIRFDSFQKFFPKEIYHDMKE